ncbi:hypothetical protein Tco_0521873 [Tanacetum coccineum]
MSLAPGLGEASCCRLKDQELEIPHCQGQCLRCGSLDEAKKEADYLIPKSSETTFVAPKTRFSEKVTQFKTLDTTSVASKSKIDEASASKAKDKVSNAFKKKKRNMRDPDILWVVDSGFQSICGSFTIKKLRFLKKFMGTVRLDTDNLQLFQAMVESSELGSKKTRLYCDVSTEIIIMAQQQHAADVHPDELCPPNKRYDLMDANKKVDLEHFWHTLKEDGSKHRLKFLLDRKELTLTLDDFRIIFHLPQANDNNHASFVPPPSFFNMVPFYKQVLGFTMELKTVSNFKIPGLLQP